MTEPSPDIDRWADHPLVKELFERMDQVQAEIEIFKEDRESIIPARMDINQAKEELRRKYMADMEKLDHKLGDLHRKESRIDNELWQQKNLLDKIRSEVGDVVDGLSAHEELLANQAQWEEILNDNTWLWIKSIFDFQKFGSEFIAAALHRNLFGVILADQMGLGKTLQATAAINLIQYTEDYEEYIGRRCPTLLKNYPPVEPKILDANQGGLEYGPQWYSVLWVCPNAIKASTMREIAKWSDDLNVIKLEGNAQERANIVKLAYEQGMVLVVSYEQLRMRNDEDLTPALFDFDWPMVVTDEAHKYKNPDTSTFFNVERIAKRAGFILPMTGTPIMNRANEFWSMLHMATLKGKYEGKFDDFNDFQNEYLHVWGSYGGSFRPDAYDKLIASIQDMVLRRRKDEVLKDLPDKIREVRTVDLRGKQRILYEEWRDKMFLWMDDQKTDHIEANGILAQLTRLRQIALLPAGVKIKELNAEGEPTGRIIQLDCWESAKIDEAMGVIEELMEADEKVLIFSNFNDPLHRIVDLVKDASYSFNGQLVESGMIIGGVHESKRDELAARFNDPDDNLRIICGNIAAMGVGLNLQGACSHSIFLDLGWNPSVNEQAEDRLHRQGQKNNVTIHIIQAENTVDAFVAAKLEEKAGVIEGVVERRELRQILEDLT